MESCECMYIHIIFNLKFYALFICEHRQRNGSKAERFVKLLINVSSQKIPPN